MILDIINKKREGLELSYQELELIFNGYLNDDVKDYQMSAFLMAICINDMTDNEIFALTDIFIKSGDTLDLSFIEGVKLDKHSTGGVGDKTTLIVAPIVASTNLPFVKMSGRGLGLTGGTIDKLLSIKNINLDLTLDEIKKQVKDINLVITSQTKNLTPLDKKVYALRDVSGTTSSIALIASSIMSKKIASGATKMVIDVKVGEGALLKDEKSAERLGELLKKIGEHYNKEVRIIYSNMNTPLGHAIGNKLEVVEAINILQGKEKGPLYDVCIELASNLISMGKNCSLEEARNISIKQIENNEAYNKFLEFINYQKGTLDLENNDNIYEIKATKSGTVTKISAHECALIALKLGSARLTKDDEIDYDAGIYLEVLENETVEKGQVLAKLYTQKDISKINFSLMFEIS